MDTIIFDIDGTVADLNHRRHHVTNGQRNWDKFFEEMVNDPPLADVVFLAEMLGSHPLAKSGFLKLFFVSGRPDSHRAHTEQWLRDNVPTFFNRSEALLMRAAGDYRPDTEIKREILHNIRSQGYNVRLVVDDRPSVIEMWKSEGVTVLTHDGGEWDTERTWKPGVLHILVGPSGAGKTYLVFNCLHNFVKNHGGYVSSDELRAEITGDFKNQGANEQVFAALHAIVLARIDGGLDTVVDATNLRARDRRALRDLVPANGQIFYHVIDRPLAEKHQDAGWRDDVVIKGVKLIDKHHQAFQSALRDIMSGDGDTRVSVIDHRRF
jgi:predicted kinase